MITFLYKNLIDTATKITENTSIPQFGTQFLRDSDLNSAYRGTTGYGTTTILFDFGSAVYADSFCCITNLTASGTLVLRAGTLSTVTDQAFTQETKTKLECPHGGSFGKDCEELPANLCSKCKIWDACAEKSKEFKGTKEETKTEPVKEETKREEPTKTTEAPVVARRRRR